MSSSARKKEKHRLKRKEKRQQIHRIQSRTALQRIAAEGGRLECWIMPADWKQAGMASIRVLGHAPGGRTATAMFLVDFWAVGLKDVFGRGDVPELELRESQIEPWIEQTGAVKLDEALARRIIAGAVRFGRQNSFRVPPEWEKYVVIFGRQILNEIPTADLSDFGIDGGIRYVGPIDFLQKRLTISTDEFLARPNVQWVMDSDPKLSQFAAEELSEEKRESLAYVFNSTRLSAQHLIQLAQQWCTEHNIDPIPQIEEAATLVVFSMLPVLSRPRDQATDSDWEDGRKLVNMILAQKPPSERQVLEGSIQRFLEVLVSAAPKKDSSGELRVDLPPDERPMLPEQSAPQEA